MFDDMRATLTRPRFYGPSKQLDASLMSNTQSPHPPGFEPGPLAWNAATLSLAP